MYSAKKIQKEITETVRESLKGSRFQGIAVTPEDDDEDIKRPSIRIVTDTQYSKEMLIKCADTTVEIYFYAEKADEYTIDCLEVQELIVKKLMEGITEEKMVPDDIDCSSAGGVLAINFTLGQEQPEVEEQEEDMHTLDLKIRKQEG